MLCVCLAVLCAEATAEVRYSITDLRTLGEGDYYVSAINNAGQVLGKAYTSGHSGGHVDFLWDPSNGLENLSSLLPDGFSLAQINDSGQMLLYSVIPG